MYVLASFAGVSCTTRSGHVFVPVGMQASYPPPVENAADRHASLQGVKKEEGGVERSISEHL